MLPSEGTFEEMVVIFVSVWTVPLYEETFQNMVVISICLPVCSSSLSILTSIQEEHTGEGQAGRWKQIPSQDR